MQTRNQKSIKFSVFTNTLVFFHGSVRARVYVVCIWSAAQFPFAFISAQSAAACAARAGILCTLHLGAWIQSINWVLISEWVWVDTIEHIFTVQGSSSVTGTLWGRGRDGVSCSIAMSRGLMDHGDQPVLSLVIPASRSSNPSSSSSPLARN